MSDFHDFKEDLEYSRTAHQPWVPSYEGHWPGYKYMDMRHPGRHQREGCDFLMVNGLKKGKVIRGDDKVRETIFPDVLLELQSVIETKKAGWLLDEEKTCDFFSYIWKPRRRLLLLGVPELRSLYHQDNQEWLEEAKAGLPDYKAWKSDLRGKSHRGANGFGLCIARSRNGVECWHTLSLTVPERVLLPAIEAVLEWGNG